MLACRELPVTTVAATEGSRGSIYITNTPLPVVWVSNSS